MLEKDPAKRFPSLSQLIVKFAAGLDSHDQGPREQLVEMVKSGPTRRQSYPPTPVSPPPGSLAASQAEAQAQAQAQARVPQKQNTPPFKTPVVTAPSDEVHSAETAAVPAVGAMGAMSADPRSRPTAAIESGQRDSISGGAAAGSKKRFPPAAIAAAVVVIAAIGIMMVPKD